MHPTLPRRPALVSLAAPTLTLALSLLLPLPALAGTTVDLAASASRPAANDLAQATVFAEASGAAPGELAQKVNGLIADGLRTAKAYKGIKVQSGGTHTYPVYGKTGRIDSWRMRSDLALESGDAAALSELLGKLQASLGVGNVQFLPAPETRKKAEDEAMLDAIAAFKARAKLAAEALGKPWRIKQLSINSSGGRPPVYPMLRAAAMAAEAVPMSLEGGESNVVVNVSGQIELAD